MVFLGTRRAGLSRGAIPRMRRLLSSSSDQAAQANAQLESLHEVSTAVDLAALGRRAEAASLLERAVKICSGSMGEDSVLTRAAMHRLAQVLYDDQRFGAAEATLRQGESNARKQFPTDLLLLSKAQLFQGKIPVAVETASRAVDLCQQDEDNTPDTDALGQALRQLGVIQLLSGEEDDAETSLLRAARLGSASADQGKGLAAVAALNIARGDEQSVEEAVELLNEACATTTESDEHKEPTATAEDEREKEGGDGNDAAASAATSKVARLAHASVLSTAAQGELVLERGMAAASERLGEALRIREQLLPIGHPATAWTLSLLARCHVAAGEAVTAEGLFRAALDSLQGIAEEVDDGIARSQRSAGAVALPLLFASPLHPYTKAATLRGFSELLLQWEKREAEGEVVARQAEKVESSLLLKPPGGLTLHMLHLDDVY
ncbi:unnamed protein product [Ectocarpus sp. CCAP 1310/34]|nr:unnamed protein product [Ectocarpus sp. CCAP 1310/34]